MEASSGTNNQAERIREGGQAQHHKRNRSRRGSRGGPNNDGGARKDNNANKNNHHGSSMEPPKKKRRNRKKGNGGNNNTKASNNNAVADMEIDSIHNDDNKAPPALAVKQVPHLADPSFMTPYKFTDQPPEAIHPDTLKAITDVMKLERLTEVQYKTLQQARITNGNQVVVHDVLGRARTGTGKTVAFLMPAIQTVLSSNNTNNSKNSIQVLVISPTRELATQITTQANQILTHHSQLSVQLIMGGTNMKTDVSRFSKKLPTILVATPGRMKDHLENTVLANKTRFANCLSGLQVLVLDEADHLLEMGFRQDIFSILSYLPSHRQTLLFSATMPKELKEVMAKAMKPNFRTVDCIHDNDSTNGNSETNVHVEQTHVIMPPGMDRVVIGVIEVLLEAIKEPDYKVIAFFPTARVVGYFAELVNSGIRRNHPDFPSVIEIHSRKSQANRNRASDMFRAAQSAILFTSDVSARGVDYPNVTTVIQFGLPDSREQYIHRLGRTGRAGKAGRGWLVLADYERAFLRELQQGGGVDVPTNPDLEELFAAPPSQEALDLLNPVLRDQIGNGSNKELVKAAQQAYQAWLGFYKDRTRRLVGKKSKAEIVQMANRFAELCGLSEQPALLKKTVGKMGLKGVPGIKTTNAL